MSKAKQLLETIYKVYNPQEQDKETAGTYDAENLRNMFIGTVMGGQHTDTIKNLRDCIDKMSDEWVAEFLRVINGDIIEQVNEDFNADRFRERATDAINALNDTIGYLKEGIGRRVDKADIETLEYATTILDDCMD